MNHSCPLARYHAVHPSSRVEHSCNLYVLFIFTAFHKHLIPFTVTPQACRGQHRGQAQPRYSPKLRCRHFGGWQGPAGARRVQLSAGRAEEPDEGAADVCGAAQGPANVMKLNEDEATECVKRWSKLDENCFRIHLLQRTHTVHLFWQWHDKNKTWQKLHASFQPEISHSHHTILQSI